MKYVFNNTIKKNVMQDLKSRYKKFAIEVGILIQELPRNVINYAYTNPLIRCSSPPGTNYRSACRGKSTADFINELKIVEEELDQSIYFLELLQHFNPALREKILGLIRESNELLAINVASIKTTKLNSRNRTSQLVP